MTTFILRQGAATVVQNGTMSGSAADTVDTTPPAIVTEPENFEKADTDLVLTFSETVQAGAGTLTLSADNKTVFSGDVATSASIKVVGNTLTLQLDEPLAYGTNYWLKFDPTIVKDLAGTVIWQAPFEEGDYVWVLPGIYTMDLVERVGDPVLIMAQVQTLPGSETQLKVFTAP